jgi:heat shock protein HslJ
MTQYASASGAETSMEVMIFAGHSVRRIATGCRRALALCIGPLCMCPLCISPMASAADGANNGAKPNTKAPSSPAPAVPLLGTEWQLVQIGATPAQREAGVHARPARLVLRREDHRYDGSSGCNRIFGTYRLDGESLGLAPVASTKMACPGPLMQQERKLVAALEATTRYRAAGHVLQLFSGDKLVARFESRPPPQER